MKHIGLITREHAPNAAMSTLEWAQIGTIVGSFVASFNTFVTALGNLLKVVDPESKDA